jgi:hypothetical protein
LTSADPNRGEIFTGTWGKDIYKTYKMENGETKPLVTDHPGFWQLFKRNWQPTIVYCFVFLGFGICVAFLGPTLLDLGCQVSEDMRKMSLVFFAQLLFVLIGSMLSGYLVNR